MAFNSRLRRNAQGMKDLKNLLSTVQGSVWTRIAGASLITFAGDRMYEREIDWESIELYLLFLGIYLFIAPSLPAKEGDSIEGDEKGPKKEKKK